VKHFKSAWKNCHHLNSHYTSYEYCNSNTATHNSHSVQTNSADQTFYYSRGTWIWPLWYQPEGETHHYPIQCGLMVEWSYTSTPMYAYMVWTGKAFTVLLFCHPIRRMEVKAVPDVGWPQGKSSILNCCTTADVYG